jgi:predicted HTH transcriptional regulator
MRRLVEERVQETFDLDFKRDLYGNSDGAKRELAADVAAMANSGGGLIILGIDEDEHACAQAAPGALADDADVTRILQIVGSLVAPVPDIDVRCV